MTPSREGGSGAGDLPWPDSAGSWRTLAALTALAGTVATVSAAAPAAGGAGLRPGPAAGPGLPGTAPTDVRDLGTLGGDWSRARGVNGRGWVVGASQVSPGRLHAVSGHAFLWRDGRMEDLGTLGGTESAARDVNDAGQVVGVAEADSGRGRRLPRRPGRRELVEIFDRAFLWEDGRMRGLGTLGGRTSAAHAVNGRGWVVGASQVSPGRLHAVSERAFLWRGGGMEDLGTLGGAESVAHDVNDAGQVVGASQTARDRSRRVQVRAFLWEDGEMRDLGTLGGGESRAYGVNDRGRVVGSSSTPSGEVHAFLWQDGEMRELGALDGGSQARAISERGGVAGTSRTARGRDGRVSVHAVAWRPEGGP